MCVHAFQVISSGAAHLDVVTGMVSGIVGKAAVNVGENVSDGEWRRNNGNVVINGEWVSSSSSSSGYGSGMVIR